MDYSYFGEPVIDTDEWRDEPVRHRYVHGSFSGTSTRFSVYLPPPDTYAGRVITFLEGGPGGNENTLSTQLYAAQMGGIQLGFDLGAVVVESNQGHIGPDLSAIRDDPAIWAYGASAQSTRLAKQLAADMYGDGPHHAYVYGGSGGGVRCIFCIEGAPDVWDGAVPFVIGNGMTTWSTHYGLMARAERLLGADLSRVVDATDPGGSGDPFDGLTSRQREALAELYRAGFPRGAEPTFVNAAYTYSFAGHVHDLERHDPTYFEDFWTRPGYAGADGELDSLRVQHKSTVGALVTGAELAGGIVPGQFDLALMMAAGSGPRPVAVVIDGIDDAGALKGASVVFRSGQAADRELFVLGAAGPALIVYADHADPLAGVAAGDEVIIDNAKYLGFMHYHRHQVVDGTIEGAPWTVAGRPVYPQRSLFGSGGMLGGGNQTGKLQRKTILLQNTHDTSCWGINALHYRSLVEQEVGDQAEDLFRLWFYENAEHAVFMGDPARLVDYNGHVAQGLADLIAWVEDGTLPPPSSAVSVTDGTLALPPTAAERRGIQPVVNLTANGGDRADVQPGDEVQLRATAEMPPGAGSIIKAEWNPDGTEWLPAAISPDVAVTVELSHRFDRPGTYFPAVRVTGTRDGRQDDPIWHLLNIARSRVVVG